MTEPGWAAVAALTALVAALIDLRVWDIHPRVPLGYNGDGVLFQSVVQGVVEHGWYQHNDLLGAPFGQDMHDLAAFSGDHLHLLAIRVLAFGFGDAAIAYNAFVLGGFALVAATAFLVLRALGVTRLPALGAAVLYSLLPYHLGRFAAHPFLADYAAVPVALWLALRAFAGAPLFAPGIRGPGRRRRPSGRTAATVAVAVALGGLGIYYAVFAVLVLLVAAARWLVVGEARKRAVPPLAVALVVVGSLGLNALPNAVYRADHGANPVVGKRYPFESESYGLKFADLVLPRLDHRVPALARLRDRYDAQTTPAAGEDILSALGVVGTAGLAVLLLTAIAAAGGGLGGGPRRALALRAAVLAGCVFGFATVGGGSAVFAEVVSPQLRAWGRGSVFIAFLALLALALAADGALERLQGRGRLRVAGIAGLVAVVLLGVLDQTSPRDARDYEAVATVWRSDRALVRDIEATLPGRAMVFQLPYVGFPEVPPVNGVAAYDEERLWLHSERIRWSAGAMRGRPEDWSAALQTVPPQTAVIAAATAGFGGVVVDQAGYPGKDVVSGVSQVAGLPARASLDGRLAFVDLRSLAARLRTRLGPSRFAQAREAVLHPPRADPVGDHPLSQALAPDSRWVGPHVRIPLINPLQRSRRVHLTLKAFSAGERTAIRLVGPDGSSIRRTVGPKGADLALDTRLPPGTSDLQIHSAGSANAPLVDLRDAHLRVETLRVVDTDLLGMLAAA
jgi:phosphoglycerol transferase